MPTSEAAEASASPSEARVETSEYSLRSEPNQIQDPADTQESKSAPSDAEGSPSPSDSLSEGEYEGSDTSETHDQEAAGTTANETQPPLPDEPVPQRHDTAPPLPNEPLPTDGSAPPLPAEPVPVAEDDGWEFHWNPNDQNYWFYNRFTGAWQQENPRIPSATAATAAAAPTATAATALAPPPPDGTSALSNPTSVAGGYNPAIHGDYDENAWYAQNLRGPGLDPQQQQLGVDLQAEDYTSAALFNRRTGQWQGAEQGTERHSDEAKSRRQMRAFFDVDAAANMHDGRSLKAERAGKKPSRAELKAFKERRKAKKEEKRRAWLRD